MVARIDLTGHNCQTHHTGYPRWHWLYVGMYHPAEKCCIHMSCSLNGWNDLILQLLQVPVICYSVLHKDQFSKFLLADYIPHGALFRMEW